MSLVQVAEQSVRAAVAIALVGGIALAQPATASLESTYWKLMELGGKAIRATRQEPHFHLASGHPAGERRGRLQSLHRRLSAQR